jgi:release factor glutamine methyltransferase
MPETVNAWQKRLAHDLAGITESAGLDGQVLLAHVAHKSRSWILAHPDFVLSEEQVKILQDARRSLKAGMPLPYILGHWEFFGLEFVVTPHVLIPRPETEILVEQALHWLEKRSGTQRVLELGVGSGCISVSLAVHNPLLQVVAVDISPQAIAVARKNAQRHQVANRFQFVISDLCSAIRGRYDLLCANLPYIPTSELQNLPVSKHEPQLALDGGCSGLDLIQRFLQSAPCLLAEKGLILAEIEASQGKAALDLAMDYFPQAQVRMVQDYSGNDRVLRIESV